MRLNCLSLRISSHCSDAVGLAERDSSYLWGASSCLLEPEIPLDNILLPTQTTADALGKELAALWQAASSTSVLAHGLARLS